MTWTIDLPPYDRDLKKVVVHYKHPTKADNIMSVALAAQLGLITFTEDDRGYVSSVTSLEGTEGFPEDIAYVRPTCADWQLVEA
jgi:hypothetical protein